MISFIMDQSPDLFFIIKNYQNICGQTKLLFQEMLSSRSYYCSVQDEPCMPDADCPLMGMATTGKHARTRAHT